MRAMRVRILIKGGLTAEFHLAGEVSLGGDDAVSPAGLCFIESPVSLFDDASPIAVGPGIDWIGGYPAADRDTHLLFRFSATKLLLLDTAPHALGGSRGAFKILPTQEKQNFFSAVTESGVAGAQALPNSLGDIPKNLVAVLVSVLVIVQLEMVYITHDETVVTCAVHGALVKRGNPFFEIQAVANLHQRVEP